ncbi:hypothetical protein MKX03_023946 [Papaver bracteatum]|nr:hypothetical protein MKX03_023946 [Papaver bracteatum]
MESRNFGAGSLDTEKSLRLCSCGLLEVMSITRPSKEWMDIHHGSRLNFCKELNYEEN